MPADADFVGLTLLTAMHETLFRALHPRFDAKGAPMTASRQRADRLLVERGLFESRAKAQAAIEAGLVTADGRPCAKASEEIPADAQLRASAAHPYVSRAAA